MTSGFEVYAAGESAVGIMATTEKKLIRIVRMVDGTLRQNSIEFDCRSMSK